ncbi:MAG TPA: phosphoribosyltransferase family protein [Candidatus Bathyarchaeia archaeon]|nr:phosphoribosyltransferase family protein [Candidatus Bathyarchaeia archaeon]
MTGLIGFYAFGEGRENWDASQFLHYGLNALHGRGEESISLATFGRTDALRTLAGKGGVEEFFQTNKTSIPKGFIGIAQTSAYPDDYLVHVTTPYELVLALDGKTDLHTDRSESNKLFARQLSQLLHSEKEPLKATTMLVNKIGGGYSFVALTHKQELIAGRNPLGVKPLEAGSVGFDIGAVASETCALDVMGIEDTGPVETGEVVMFTPEEIRGNTPSDDPGSFCSYEYVYLARLDSKLNNTAVAKVRNNIGRELAKTHLVKTDSVIGVPETALPIANGYSHGSGIPLDLGFVRTGENVRAALKPSQKERLTGIQLKLNPVKSAVEGKGIVLVDDSVVRGNTLRNTVLELKRKGAHQVHVRIGSPPLVSPCPYGVEIPPRDELISSSLDEKELAKTVGADSISFMTVQELQNAIGLPGQNLCTRCFEKEDGSH